MWVSFQAGLTDFFSTQPAPVGAVHLTLLPRSLPPAGRKSWSAVGSLPPLVGPGPVGPALVAETYVITAPHLRRTDTTPSTRTGLPAFLSQLFSPHRFSVSSSAIYQFPTPSSSAIYQSSLPFSSVIYQSSTPSRSAIYQSSTFPVQQSTFPVLRRL
jgi:hypothetical protein